MTIHAALNHRTVYRYDRLIEMGPQLIRLRPAPHCRTPVLSYSLRVEPEPHFLNWQQDPFGNFLARAVFPERVRNFEVTVDLVADMAVINPFDFFLEESAEHWPFVYEPALKSDLTPYLMAEPAGPLLTDWLAGVDRTRKHTVDFLTELNQRLESDIDYVIRMEPGVQSPETTLGSARGSCRDSGWLLVQILRNLGLAARFVSGYLIQLKPDVKALDGPSGTDHDFTDLHAWAEAYVPGAGWIGLDPTSGLLAGEGHLPLAATPAPISAAPITGTHEAAEVEFSHHMEVTRLSETPRVTKPYSEDDWARIKAVGAAVDQRLQAADTRLTMGGEPTFVSIDDMDGDEWNTAAVGPTKRRYAEGLARRLRDRFAPGGALHYGQGKWYPGEPLPRWAFGIYWRRDHRPLWRDASLIEDESSGGTASTEDAEHFAHLLCDELGVDREHTVPAFEDVAHFVVAEQQLPVNLDPSDNKLDDPLERQRMMRVFERGLTEPTAFVLPVQVWQARDGRREWMSERWKLRREHLFLIPGDSPAGLRLPLGSLPDLPPGQYPNVNPLDPFAAHAALPAVETLIRDRRGASHEDPPAPATASGPTVTVPSDVSGAVRTAITVEPLDGRLTVFMPPLEDAEDYAALLGAVEEAAGRLGRPVQINGYTPPTDPRLNWIKITPDPGVIEVNIHPATSWDEAVDITTTLYEEARLARLGTEKFMLDGRHTGTGGGNHIVLGGAKPEDSPFLRRPDLLASLIRFWQRHPSLSYLFSGLFIGPTSQAPRVDEARHESLYELEIALAQVPDPGQGEVPPWLVDRLFRNLLIDVTGNTHRAEICIDKLYSPDSASGRLGLVEFRAFEMPPHARMSLVQQLFLRALVAWLWEHPYHGGLVRWGTDLHDRFMLPHFVWADFRASLQTLRDAGFALEDHWFAPHYEFRFPVYGSVSHAGIELEIRQALEPWNVLGEEGRPGGTARYVDSSMERLQVRVNGLTDGRHIVTCNGIALPLHPTGRRGEAVAGVRYRAWQPASCLHPTIGVHSPLTFDIVDSWSERSIGGCRYHVAHPGGRNHETFPVNAFEAEGRRLARFEDMGHTPGVMRPSPPVRDPDFPYTLDLRRF